MKEQLMNLIGDFTWDFGQNFFIETVAGNFVWSDPEYCGDNTVRPFMVQSKIILEKGLVDVKVVT